jgi:PAS domain-containing protein
MRLPCPDDRIDAENSFKRYIENPEEIVVNQFRAMTSKGYVWFEATAKNYLNNPAISGILVIMHNVSERKKAEQALKVSNECLSLFIKHSPIHAYIKDVSENESKVLYASENYEDMIGIKGSDMVGKNMFELFPAEFAKKITDDDWAVVSNQQILKLDEELNGRHYTTIKFPIRQADKNLLAGYTIEIIDRIKSVLPKLSDLTEEIKCFT